MAGRPPTKQATEFGNRVAAARQQRGLTQRELADRIGVSQAMVEYYERRATNVKSHVVVKLADALGVSTDELLGCTPTQTKPGRKSAIRHQIEKVEQLPRQQQKQILDVVSALVAQAQAAG